MSDSTLVKSPILDPVPEGELSELKESGALNGAPRGGGGESSSIGRWPMSGRFRRSIDASFSSLRPPRRTSEGSIPTPRVSLGYSDGETISRATSDPSSTVVSSPTSPSPLSSPSATSPLTQVPSSSSSSSFRDPDWYTQQSADLIMNALSRSTGTTPSASRTSTPVPPAPPVAKPTVKVATPAPKSDLNKPTAGALAALGFRAAAVAGPTVTPPTVIPPTPIDAPVTTLPAPKPTVLSSRPVGGLAAATKVPSRSRSPSPFFRARKSREERRARDKSPDIQALRKDSVTDVGAESDGESVGGQRGRFRPQASAYESPDESGDEQSEADQEHDNDSELEHTDEHTDEPDGFDVDDFFDDETNQNTEANAVYDAPSCDDETTKDPESVDPATRQNFDVYGEEIEQDVLGEGPNVVVPQEPIFQAPSAPGPKRRKSVKSGLEMVTSRPAYARDRCTVTINQGDPDGALDKSGKRMRRYVVLSDLSEESRYAVEWAVGTVARDGDEIFLISVMEDESKVDPKKWSSKDQSLKLKVQKERQSTAVLLSRQVTGLLSRTRLNITVTCQALHAKNARHMLLDLIDFLEPTLVIVGSRGLGQLKG